MLENKTNTGLDPYGVQNRTQFHTPNPMTAMSICQKEAKQYRVMCSTKPKSRHVRPLSLASVNSWSISEFLCAVALSFTQRGRALKDNVAKTMTSETTRIPYLRHSFSGFPNIFVPYSCVK